MKKVKKCKKCKREFVPKREKQIYCCPNCKVAEAKGCKPRWERIIEVYEDKRTAALLGYTIRKNSDG